MILEIVIIILIIIAGFNLAKFSVNKTDAKRLRLLWMYHLLFGIFYWYFTLNDGGSDSLKYWAEAQKLTSQQAIIDLFAGRGTLAMYAFNYIPASVLDLSFFSLTIIYAFIGFIGLYFFYKLSLALIPYNSKIASINIFPTIFFLPTLHFWSSGVGKDTLLFTSIALFSYALLNINRYVVLIIISMVISYFIRPHVALYLLLSFSLAFLINSKIPMYKRVFLSSLLMGAGIVLLPIVMEYAKIEEISIDSYNSFASGKAAILSRANVGSRVDMASYPLPLKVFTFLYRPLFFDINNILSAFASVENFILLLLSYAVIRNKPIATFKAAPFIVKGLLFLLLIGSMVTSASLGNLGIMIRMRNMFLPALLIYILWSFSRRTEMRIKQQKSLSQ